MSNSVPKQKAGPPKGHPRLAESWRVAGESAGLMVWDWNASTNDVAISKGLAKFLGGPMPKAASGKLMDAWLDRVPASEREELTQVLEQLLNGDVVEAQCRHGLRAANGEIAPTESHIAVVAADENGYALRIVGSVRDLSLEHDTQAALKESELRFRMTLDNSPIGLALVSLDGGWLMVNRALCDMLGYSREELLCKTFQDITHPDDLDEDLSLLNQLLSGERNRYRMEKRYFCKDGSQIWIQLDVSLLRGPDHTPLHFISQIQNITCQRKLEERLHHQAYTDSLTDLPNRPAMEQALAKWLKTPARDFKARWLIYLDVDHFKLINDRAGHAAGDAMLQHLAQILRERTGEKDFLARVGGDEFVVLLQCAGEAAVREWTDALLAELDQTPLLFHGDSFRASISMGVVSLIPLTRPADVLIQADTAAYAAKAAGRGRCHFFADTDETIRRLISINSWAEQIERGFAEDRFCLFLERIVDPSGQVLGYEALIRLHDALGGVIGPDAFLPTVQQLDWTARVDRWVLVNAAKLLSGGGVHQIPSNQFLSVNISARSLNDASFAAWLTNWITDQVFDRSQLHLEITETQQLNFGERESRLLEAIRATGAEVWLDDFGTGFNSFDLLKRMTIDGLKIDRCYTHDLINDPIDSAMIQTIATVSRRLGLSLVAEGVDQQDTVELLSQFGIAQQQGWFFHRAEEPERALAGAA